MSKVSTQYGKGVEICVSWLKASNGEVPHRAVRAGGQCFVARAQHNNEYIPGKLVDGHKGVYICYGGKEVLIETNILHHEGVQWTHTSGNSVPRGAIVGGTDSGNPLYIARSDVNGEVVVGKYSPAHGCAFVPYGGGEQTRNGVDVLCCVPKNL